MNGTADNGRRQHRGPTAYRSQVQARVVITVAIMVNLGKCCTIYNCTCAGCWITLPVFINTHQSTTNIYQLLIDILITCYLLDSKYTIKWTRTKYTGDKNTTMYHVSCTCMCYHEPGLSTSNTEV